MLVKRRFPDGGGFERLILITPSESLSRQHADALRSHTRMGVFVYPDDGDARAIAEQPGDTMIVIDINKLADDGSSRFLCAQKKAVSPPAVRRAIVEGQATNLDAVVLGVNAP